MKEDIEEILFEDLDTGWGVPLPVKLITYPNGKMDLHRQTGTNFPEAIAKAEEILKQRGLKLRTNRPEFIGPTGAYMTVLKS